MDWGSAHKYMKVPNVSACFVTDSGDLDGIRLVFAH